MDYGLTLHTREKQLWNDCGKCGGVGTFPQSKDPLKGAFSTSVETVPSRSRLGNGLGSSTAAGPA